jgi:cytochrome c
VLSTAPRLRSLAATLLVVPFLLASLAVPAHAETDPEDPGQGEHEFSALLFTATTAFRHDSIPEGIALFESLSDEYGFDLTHTEDSSIFNDEDLAEFDVLVMLQASGDPWSPDEKAAMEAYQQAGGGIVAVHNAADMRGGYDWWDELIGSLMPAHAATGQDPGLDATVQVEDAVHPSTSHLESWEWERADEWYNFSTNVRGDAHVLLTMDETTYDPGGEAMGYDHPISWCKGYDGGRAWVTAMGHFGSHYSEPDLIDHLYGGVQWAAGAADGDCGGTDWDSYDKVSLDSNTSAPFAMDVAPDGRVFFTEVVRGQIRVFDPATHTTSTALDIDVYSGGEDGMLGLALDPDFEENGHLYQYYSPPSNEDVHVNRLSRFTVDADTGLIDPDSESVVIEVPKQRFDQPGHTGGDVAFDNDGNLLLSVGDDVNPHTEPSPRSAPLSAIEGTFHDARVTSANTDDLRGKLLRITPEDDGGYSIPDGNLFEPGTDNTRPEIFAMGFRNPFRFTVDPATGRIGLADYGPDCDTLAECGDYGPTGTVSWSLITEPGNYGWPMCHGGNAYRDVDYTTDPRTFGELFDCDNPVNDSPNNTGLTELPPVTTPDLVYGYQESTVPEVIAPGGGLAPMGGPFYAFDPELESDTKFPEYFAGKPFFYEWSKNSLYSLIVDGEGEEGERLDKINPFLPEESWLAPIDMEFGPDGSLYVLEWGGGFGRDNPDSGLYRVDYVADGRSPVANASAEPESGPAPLEVQFDGTDSYHPEEGEEIVTYEWDFTNDGEVDSTEPDPQHTYTEEGEYNARLTVTGSNEKQATDIVPIVVGNTRPEVDFEVPPDGGFFEWGDEISWSLDISDAEDAEIDPDRAYVQPGIGHDDHVHHTEPVPGLTGSVVTGLGGHSRADNAFYTLEANYTDQGTDTMPPLTGTNTAVLQPKTKQAEHHVGAEGVSVEASTDVEVGNEVLAGLGEGSWSRYDPVNFTDIDQITFRVASGAEGGAIELRSGAPDGDLLGTAEVPDTGGVNSWADVSVDAPETTDTLDLHLVYTGEADFRLNFFQVVGQGVSPAPSPQVSLTAPEQGAIFDSGEPVELAADAEVAEGGIESVEFFAGDELIGSDDEAPYEAVWSDAPDGTHLLRARAVTEDGSAAESRSVRIEIGDDVVRPPWQTFTNREAEFSQLGEDSFVISAQGANAWQGTDEYGAVFLPGAAEGDFWAQVQVVDHDAPNTSSKAGLIVRNDITAPGEAGGYLLVHRQGSGDFEALWDTSGDGTPDTAAALEGGDTPQWVAVEREGDLFRALASTDGESWEEFAEVEIADAAVNSSRVVVSRASILTFPRFELQWSPRQPRSHAS